MITKSWTHDTIIIGIHSLGEWGRIKPSFPFPGPGKTEVLAITEGKKSTFTRPARRVYTEPDYINPLSVSSALKQLKTDILSDFARAFATNLDSSKVADVPPVKITLKNNPNTLPIKNLAGVSLSIY